MKPFLGLQEEMPDKLRLVLDEDSDSRTVVIYKIKAHAGNAHKTITRNS